MEEQKSEINGVTVLWMYFFSPGEIDFGGGGWGKTHRFVPEGHLRHAGRERER